MPTPGRYKASELTDVGNGQRLANEYAPSWLGAVKELEKEFGFAPIITVSWPNRKIGAYRTRLQQISISPASPDYSDHCRGRAVDISNQRAFRNIDEAKFERVLAKWDWLNSNTAGHPFPSEPWHFANRSSNPAGAGERIDEKKGVRKMFRAALRDTNRVAFFDSITFYETSAASADDNAWGRFVGKPGLTVSQDEWDSYQRVAAVNAAKLGAGSSAGVPPDLSGLATHEDVVGISGQISNLPVPPTVEAIATAVNTDAAQRLAE